MASAIDTGGGGFSGSSAATASGDDGGRQSNGGHVFNFGSSAGAGTSPMSQYMMFGMLAVVGLMVVMGARK